MTYANLVAADGGSPRGVDAVDGRRSARSSSPRSSGSAFGFIASRSEGIYFLMLDAGVLGARLLLLLARSRSCRGSAASTTSTCRAWSATPARTRRGSTTWRWSSASSCTCACDTCRARRSGSRCRACATSRRGCARSGFNVRLHRTLAFTLRGLHRGASPAILAVWYNRRISPGLDQPRADDRHPRDRRHRRAVPARGRLGGGAHVRAAGQLLARVDAGDRQRAGRPSGSTRCSGSSSWSSSSSRRAASSALWESGSTACAGETKEVARHRPRHPGPEGGPAATTVK